MHVHGYVGYAYMYLKRTIPSHSYDFGVCSVIVDVHIEKFVYPKYVCRIVISSNAVGHQLVLKEIEIEMKEAACFYPICHT